MNIRNIYPAGYEVRKRRSQHFAFGIFSLLSVLVVAILFAILGFIIYKGIGVISWDFLTESPTDGMTAGGIWPAIVGTFYLMIGSALFAFPVGVMSGIYMNEYAPKGKLVRFIRVMTNNLSGIPSIVFGLFGMALFVNSIKQIKQLEKAGCDIVRLAVPRAECAEVFSLAKKAGVKCPLVADIHFDYKIALECVKHGVDKVRINPGNIGEKWKVKEVAEACKNASIPIRIGVNGGSLDKKLLAKYSHPCAEALASFAISLIFITCILPFS